MFRPRNAILGLLACSCLIVGHWPPGANRINAAGSLTDRDRIAGQVIFNTVTMDRERGKVADADIRKWLAAAENDLENEFQYEVKLDNKAPEAAKRELPWDCHVKFLKPGDNADNDKLSERQKRIGQGVSKETGGHIFYEEKPDGLPPVGNVYFRLIQDGVELRMHVSRPLAEGAKTAIEKALPRWNFFIAEAVRLNLIGSNYWEWLYVFDQLLKVQLPKIDQARGEAAAYGLARETALREQSGPAELLRKNLPLEDPKHAEAIEKAGIVKKLQETNRAIDSARRGVAKANQDATKAIQEIMKKIAEGKKKFSRDHDLELSRNYSYYKAIEEKLPYEMAMMAGDTSELQRLLAEGQLKGLPAGLRLQLADHLLATGDPVRAIFEIRDVLRAYGNSPETPECRKARTQLAPRNR